jgi:hypothetical protein
MEKLEYWLWRIITTRFPANLKAIETRTQCPTKGKAFAKNPRNWPNDALASPFRLFQ